MGPGIAPLPDEPVDAPRPLRPGDPHLPAIRARLATLAWGLWRQRVLDGNFLSLAAAPTEAPLLWLFGPLWRRLRLALLGEELVTEIIPAIAQRLSVAGTLVRKAEGLTPSAPVDWPETWRATMSGAPPGTLVTRRWQRSLDLPHNRLAALALRNVAGDVAATQREPLPDDERATLAALGTQAVRTLASPPWNSLQPESAADLLPATRQALLTLPPTHRPPYQALLGWWQRYTTWRQTELGDLHHPGTEAEPDLLFELLALFELAAALARRLPIRQRRPLGSDPTAPLFVGQTPRGPLTIFYQTGSMFAAHRRLSAVWGTPDMVVGLPDGRYVILDAKNIAPANHAQALYKMMGYLYNFSYQPGILAPQQAERIAAGVLVFPSAASREGPGLVPWHDTAQGGQAIFSLVLPPSPNPHLTGMAELADWLLSV